MVDCGLNYCCKRGLSRWLDWLSSRSESKSLLSQLDIKAAGFEGCGPALCKNSTQLRENTIVRRRKHLLRLIGKIHGLRTYGWIKTATRQKIEIIIAQEKEKIERPIHDFTLHERLGFRFWYGSPGRRIYCLSISPSTTARMVRLVCLVPNHTSNSVQLSQTFTQKLESIHPW